MENEVKGMNFGNVSQIIPTIQGEGPGVGITSLLIRFRACNLQCPWCDTQWSGKHTDAQFNLKSIHNIIENNQIRNIMFTGGEPFLYISQMEWLCNEIRKMIWNSEKDILYFPTIEIETNGSLINERYLKRIISMTPSEVRLCVSPKLNPNMYKEEWDEGEILTQYMDKFSLLDEYRGKVDFICKLVYGDQTKEEVESFLESIESLGGVDISRIYIMPLTPDMNSYDLKNDVGQLRFLNDFRKSCVDVVNFCLKHGYTYSSREHVFLFMDKKDEVSDM